MTKQSCCERIRKLIVGIVVATIVCLLSAGILITLRPNLLSVLPWISTPEVTVTPSPTYLRTNAPAPAPTLSPSIAVKATEEPTRPRTYNPGVLNVIHEGIKLSEGLSVKIIAKSGDPVQYKDGKLSRTLFHHSPDGGDSFVDTRPGNTGGWVYVSNSKADESLSGGVGAITFSSSGEIIDYRMVLSGSSRNSGGGRTPWNSWISCEEKFGNGTGIGNIYQVDPFGQKEAEVATIGRGDGNFGSFAYDTKDETVPRFYASEGRHRGVIRRFTPKIVDWEEPWNMLHGRGTIDYLFMNPTSSDGSAGTFQWTKELYEARINAGNIYPDCEGIDVDGNKMYLLSQRWSTLWILDLELQTYTSISTENGLFDSHPEHIGQFLKDADNNDEEEESDLLYYTGELGHRAAVYGANRVGDIVTILEGPSSPDIPSGLSFSPDRLHMIVAYKVSGIVLDITRTDGYAFRGRTLDVKYLNLKDD